MPEKEDAKISPASGVHDGKSRIVTVHGVPNSTRFCMRSIQKPEFDGENPHREAVWNGFSQATVRALDRA